MKRKITIMGLVLGLMLAFTATAAFATSQGGITQQEAQPQPNPASTITATQEITNPVAMLIADFFDLNAEDVLALHQNELGYGEIAKVYLLARLSGASADELIARFLAGEGWGRIMRDVLGYNGLKGYNLGMIVSGREPVTTTTVSPAKHIAQRFGLTVTEVVTLRDRGMSWGQIKRALESGLTLQDIQNRLHEGWRETRHHGKGTGRGK